MMRGLTRIHLIFGFLAVVMATTVVWFIHYVDRPEIRYALMPCHYENIYRREGPVDVLILGSSRTMQGVSAEVISKTLGAPGKPAIVANLARSWRGNGQLFREFLDANGSLGIRRAVLVELSQFQYARNRTTTYYAGYYPNYEAVVPSSDFISDWHSKPREPIDGRLRDLLGQYLRKIDKNLELLIEGRLWQAAQRKSLPKQPATNMTCSKGENPIKKLVLRKTEQKLAAINADWRQYRPVSWDFLDINEDRPGHYIRRFKQEAERLGIDVYFILVPRYLNSPADPTFIAKWQKHFGIRLLSPPVGVMEKMFDGGYADNTHMIEKGRGEFSRWLGGQIKLKPVAMTNSPT